MPYCLIGKIVVWASLSLFVGALLYGIFFDIANRYRKQLLNACCADYHFFWIERLEGFLCNYIKSTPAALFMGMLLLIPAALFGLLELAVRYALTRFRKPAAPAALA